MVPPNTASPGEVKPTALMPSPTLSPSGHSVMKRADHPLTTPYVFPPECTLNYVMKSSSISVYGKTEETFLYLNMRSNEHFSSCQPTGVEEGYAVRYGRLRTSAYRGAVCPSGWMAFDVGLESQTRVVSRKTLPIETDRKSVCRERVF